MYQQGAFEFEELWTLEARVWGRVDSEILKLKVLMEANTDNYSPSSECFNISTKRLFKEDSLTSMYCRKLPSSTI